MQIRALPDKVLIRVSPPEAKVGAAGIIVARESREDEHIGQVVACSPAAPVKEGDRVLFQKLPKGMPYDTAIVGDEQLLVLRESEVLAVLEDERPYSAVAGLDLSSDAPLQGACDQAGVGESCESCQ